tara:strand:+ start:26 stop:346 length:321 start_codon:yes stop_codon:yes gene_type:complete
MNGMKFNAALIFAVLLQAIGLVWYVSKIDSKVNILYEKYAEDNKTEVVENQVRMKLDIENLLKDVNDIKTELKKANNKDKKIMKQHNQIFKLLKKKKKVDSNYSYE